MSADIWHILASLLTLTFLEIILGVDNLVFISILSSRLPKEQQPKARRIGLFLALITRLILLASAVWLAKLNTPLFQLFGFDGSIRNLFLLGGGLFLLYKGTSEIHEEFEASQDSDYKRVTSSFVKVVVLISVFDIIFSLDSVLTAIGLTPHFWLMATAIGIAIAMMMLAAEPLSEFDHDHPSIKILALSFILLIGLILVADAFNHHIPRGYIYFAISFSVFVEFINMWLAKKKKAALR